MSILNRFRSFKQRIRRRIETCITRLLCKFPKSQFIRKCFIRYCSLVTTEEVEPAKVCDFDFHTMVERYAEGLSSDHKAELMDFINKVTKKKDIHALDRLHALRYDKSEQRIEYVNGDNLTVISKIDRDAAARRIEMRAPAC